MAVNNKKWLRAIAACGILTVATSCREREEYRDSTTSGESHAETEPVLSRIEFYEMEFRRLVACSNMTVNATESVVNELCNEIDKSLPEHDAVQLFDRLGEMAATQTLFPTNPCAMRNGFYKRQNHLAKLWYITMNAFVFAQHHRQESFKDWDRLFRFYGRYTDEIAEAEEGLQSQSRIGTEQRLRQENHLCVIRNSLKQAVHVMRKFFYPNICEGLSEEQKADILRRFAEVEKYTAMPPDFHGK